MTDFRKLLDESKVANRRDPSRRLVEKVKQSLVTAITPEKLPESSEVSIFCAGSVARQEAGSSSDLDLFILHRPKDPLDATTQKLSRLHEFVLYSELIRINNELKLEEFSNDGEFLRVYPVREMSMAIGLPRDDHENLFTARILLLLESCCLFNDGLYRNAVDDVTAVYFRDDKDGNRPFRPYFLVNDLLRYWRTICLNYETSRYSRSKSWRKKNFNLKFPRMLTVYSTVLSVAVSPTMDRTRFADLIVRTPLERLAWALDIMGDHALLSKFSNILDIYEHFLAAKENHELANELPDTMRKEFSANADVFSDFFRECLMHEAVPRHMQKVIML